MEDPAHIILKANILNEVHTNKQEHKENYFQFVFYFIFYALLGIIAGALVDVASKKARNNSNSKAKCFGILLLQLLAIGTIVYVLMQFKFKSGISFDDWLMATWSGFIFSLAFFTTQKSISDLIQIVFN